MSAESTIDTAPDMVIENTAVWVLHIDGNNHTIAADTPEAIIRETLSMRYPGARDAQITYDSVIVEGQKHKRLTFTKRGGNKGLDPAIAALIATLCRVPPVPLAEIRASGCTASELRGAITFAQFLSLVEADSTGKMSADLEVQLWRALAQLPAARRWAGAVATDDAISA